MNQCAKRCFALFMVIIICMSFLPMLSIGVYSDSVTGKTVTYRYNGNYVYNWGTREEVATFLSPMAEAFYDDFNISFDELSKYSGGTTQSNVPSSTLYIELNKLMKNAHDYQTSYGATRDLYKYTDCERNGNVISSFYSGKSIGPSWDSGATWNREHTWPNSKGLDGNDENDIMMLRPTSVSENSSRGNKAYGKSGGYYNPNMESNGEHDLRGDVSRIFLYVYVRWGNTNKAWGTGGVMENPTILLEWMEADPVDTWEMGRNDSVQSITGTRNVFVDYPELAFLLFDEEIPSDMITPSRATESEKPTPPADDECNHIYANACDTSCDICGEVRKVGNHVYDYYCDNECNYCGATRSAAHIYYNWQIVTEPTTTTLGIERGICIYCGKETERDIPMLTPPDEQEPTTPPADVECVHAFGEWENENGTKKRICTKCGEVDIMVDDDVKPQNPLSGRSDKFFVDIFEFIYKVAIFTMSELGK